MWERMCQKYNLILKKKKKKKCGTQDIVLVKYGF